jgi:hypothetical protein
VILEWSQITPCGQEKFYFKSDICLNNRVKKSCFQPSICWKSLVINQDRIFTKIKFVEIALEERFCVHSRTLAESYFNWGMKNKVILRYLNPSVLKSCFLAFYFILCFLFENGFRKYSIINENFNHIANQNDLASCFFLVFLCYSFSLFLFF